MMFSLLIANHNNSRFLNTAVQSILAQTHASWEIVLVDDGSTDDFEQVILLFQNDSRIKIIRQHKQFGVAYTKWNCAKNAIGDILAFVDPDDALVPQALEIMAAAHLNYPAHSLIHSTHYVCDAELNPQRISLKPKILPENTPYLMLSDGSIHHFATFKKLLYDNTPGLTSQRRYPKAVDQELYYLLEETGPVLFINQPLYYYRIHKGSISNWGQEAEAMKWHNTIIEEACLRRIQHYRIVKTAESRYWIRKYRTRYYKVCIINSVRQKQWLRFLKSAFFFPFVGGMSNILQYISKIPRQGMALLRKSFTESYQH